MHEYPSKAIVTLTHSHIRFTPSNGNPNEMYSEPGIVTWFDAGRQAIENLSDEPTENIEIEFKMARSPAVQLAVSTVNSSFDEPMPASQEPHHHLKYQNQYMRVLEVKLEPGESSLFHTHSNDVLYVILSDALVIAQKQGERWGPQTVFQAGAVSFDNASKMPYTHHLKNIGKTEFHSLNIEFLP